MTRTITLKRGGLSIWDDGSPLSLPDDLMITYEGTSDNGEYITKAVCNGNKTTYKGTSITIPREALSAGRLELTVTWRYKGTDMTRFRIEPLIISEDAGELTSAPEITALTTEIAALKTQINELMETVKNVEKRTQNEMQELAKGITAVQRYAESVKNDITRRIDVIEGGYDPLKV